MAPLSVVEEGLEEEVVGRPVEGYRLECNRLGRIGTRGGSEDPYVRGGPWHEEAAWGVRAYPGAE